MDTTRTARLIVANAACFLAFWIARLAVPWWFGVPALVVFNVALTHRNQKLFRLYHGLQTCFIIIYLALTADNHTLQEFLAILLLTALFELYLWLVGNLTLSAESPAQFLRVSIIACCYAVLGNTDPMICAAVLAVMLAASMLAAVVSSDPHATRRLIPGFIILAIVFVAAVASPIVQAPTLPRAAVWLLPGTPSSTPKPASAGELPVNLPALTLRRVMQEHFWELFGFMYVPLAVMAALLLAATIVSVTILHNSWGKTMRLLAFPIAIVVSALLFSIIYTAGKTAQIAGGIAGLTEPLNNLDDVVEALRDRNILPPPNDEIKATLEMIVASAYWLGASLLFVSIVASIRDMVFEFHHEILLSMLDKSERKKVLRAVRRLVSLDEGALLEDPVTSITAMFAMGVETVRSVGPALRRGETASEFALRVATESPPCAAQMETLSSLFGKARYSRTSVTGDDVLSARSALQELRLVVRAIRQESRTARKIAHSR
ncbi:MAG: DUF4129 domain-containing protein [Candidatus Cryosericum sp.]